MSKYDYIGNVITTDTTSAVVVNKSLTISPGDKNIELTEEEFNKLSKFIILAKSVVKIDFYAKEKKELTEVKSDIKSKKDK